MFKVYNDIIQTTFHMDLLNKYFGTLKFQYTETKRSYAVYVACIKNMLGGTQQRYVLAFVPEHLGVQTTTKLSELAWQNLQMRLCPAGTYKVQPQPWVANLSKDSPEVMLTVKERKETYSSYETNISKSVILFPFEVLMFNNPKKKTIYQYPNEMNLYWAIEQFNTMFNHKNQNSYGGSPSIVSSNIYQLPLYTDNNTIEFL